MLTINDLNVIYPLPKGSFHAVKGIDLKVEEGEFFTLLGPSGCGKTTTLRSVAGLEEPTSGRIEISGKPVFDSDASVLVPPQHRDIGMVFQSYAIWPHMSVAKNVAFPLETQKLPKAEIDSRTSTVLELVGLAKHANRSATMLSGGQQQRVALARALVRSAALLLLDEPLSNLDAKLREQMRAELRDLQTRLGQTTIYVTHDQEEALAMSDRIAFIEHGEVVELGSPTDLYLKPRHISTARFLGQAEMFKAQVPANAGGLISVRTDLGELKVHNPEGRVGNRVMIRPEHILFTDEPGQASDNSFTGRITARTFSGRYLEYVVDVGGHALNIQASSSTLQPVGQEVHVSFPPDKLVLLEGGDND